VILGWVTKVPLPLVTSTNPRSTKFWIAFRTVVRLTLNRSTKPPSDGLGRRRAAVRDIAARSDTFVEGDNDITTT
jgi:hypothetical protein